MTSSTAAPAPSILGGPSLPQERRLVTTIPGPISEELMARKHAAVASGVGTTMPVFAAGAGGGVLVDVDGNSLIDLGSGIAVTGVGNSNPRVVEAVTRQLQEFTHTCFTITPYDSYVEVAEALNRLIPGDHAKRTALFNSGAEAVENAVKIARSHTKKQAVVAFDHAYHGRTNLTMALTAKSMPYKSGFGPFASEVYRAPLSYPFRDGGLTGPEAAQRAITQIEKQIGADNLAAIIVEPIQGEGGFIVPADGFLPALLDWARANDVVFIADEVQTGFARTGAMFASERFDIVPDLIITAKGIAGGLPLSAVTGRAEIMDAPHVGGLGGTYGGNPLACVAALAAIEAYEEEDLAASARAIETRIVDRFTAAQTSDPRIGDIRGRGAMMAVEFVDPATGEPDAALTARVAKASHQAGVIVLTCGTYGNVVRFLPPLTIPLELLDEGLDVVLEALAAN
ncbi:4-aminobutyrate--2-oxoglutarate transaminase [Plantibacter sp. MCCC 1A11337]|uniref:4-aminobutyrate--2-oxoglutarate transaminase n=1 Tax=Plantibacter sp. MCCC 1A11337 TaxID=2736644 RepID=UPI00158175BE|nr:4-aminobutyrate--2-oxoglutarate transaminase [Plantibacter sp. MCCC 1A11337]NUJ87690.1 4-aminobutyrate--2-oxoglutarate transaminase [Plantibacter sp. MCCC 1A11337]